MAQVTGTLLLMWETQMEFPAPSLGSAAGCYRDLGSEQADERFSPYHHIILLIYLCVFIYMTYHSAFQVN